MTSGIGWTEGGIDDGSGGCVRAREETGQGQQSMDRFGLSQGRTRPELASDDAALSATLGALGATVARRLCRRHPGARAAFRAYRQALRRLARGRLTSMLVDARKLCIA
jgi:hypothetical protein